MTLRIPRWTLAVVTVLGVAAVAFALGKLSADDQASPTQRESSVRAPCIGDLGLRAVSNGEAENFLRNWFGVPYGTPVDEFFSIERVDCADLTADGATEMVVQFVAGASGGAAPWVVFEDTGGRWQPTFLRTGLGRERVAAVSRRGIRTNLPSYAVGDPLCCPTADRRGWVTYVDGEFTYRPDTGRKGRAIEVDPDGASRLTGVDLATLTPYMATQAFGLPSSVYRSDVMCETQWADIGLTINFANLGGDNPCAGKGAVATARVEGPPASQSGWQTEEGLTVGMSIEQMLDIHPKAQTSQRQSPEPEYGLRGRGFVLETKPSVVGEGTSAPSLIARIEDGEVISIELSVGAAGD